MHRKRYRGSGFAMAHHLVHPDSPQEEPDHAGRPSLLPIRLQHHAGHPDPLSPRLELAPPGGQHVLDPVRLRRVRQRNDDVVSVPEDVHRDRIRAPGHPADMVHDREERQEARDRADNPVQESFVEACNRSWQRHRDTLRLATRTRQGGHMPSLSSYPCAYRRCYAPYRFSTSASNSSMSCRITSRLERQKSGVRMSNPNRAASSAAAAMPHDASRSSYLPPNPSESSWY